MSYEKEINNKAQELGQKYFPNHLNIWARPNVESHHVECACIEMSEYVKNKMIEKACEWLRRNYTNYMVNDLRKYIEDVCMFDIFDDSLVDNFRKAMEE